MTVPLLRTGRGLYHLVMAAPVRTEDGNRILALALERADGIERVAFGCRVAEALLDSDVEPEQILATLSPWIERGFEEIRENALKTIRAERKLHEIVFDQERSGPFKSL